MDTLLPMCSLETFVNGSALAGKNHRAPKNNTSSTGRRISLSHFTQTGSCADRARSVLGPGLEKSLSRRSMATWSEHTTPYVRYQMEKTHSRLFATRHVRRTVQRGRSTVLYEYM
jgi:hypothetical protein